MLDSVLPVIQCDCGYLTDAGEVPVVAWFASYRSLTTFSPLCAQRTESAIACWIWEQCHARLIIQSDGEPAILALVAAVRHKVIADGEAEQITCLVSPKGSHESNGAAERTAQQVRGMARIHLKHVREKTGSKFPRKSPWWAWALRHAAWIYNRFHVRSDTRTKPHSNIRLKTYAQTVLPFGVLILARRPGAQVQKSETQFVYGCWLGRDSHTDEHIVGSKAGLFRTRTVRRLTEDKSWSAEAVTDMEWTLWKTAAMTRGRPPKAAVGERNEPIWNAPLSREPPPRSAAPKARSETVLEATSTSDKPDVHERSPPRPEDECAAKQSRVDNTSPCDLGGASSSSTTAAPSTPIDPWETTPAKPTRPRSPGQPKEIAECQRG